MEANAVVQAEAARRERIRLRGDVLRYGGLLGWQASEVIAFTEALTRCPWRRCGCVEFWAVLDEYLAIMEVIQAKATRRLITERGGACAAEP